MPTHPEDFQKALLPWSRWKHEILIKYLQAMAAILRTWRVIYYVDGFAGPGRYIDDEAEGSPLLAAKHARALSESDADYSLKCINVELEDDVFQNLEIATAEYSDHTDNFHGEFGNFVPEIVNKVSDKPALFFLDPLGVKGLEWSALLPVLDRRYTTELLIRFDANAALRHTGHDTRHHATFNAVLGEDSSEYWQRYMVNCNSSSEARRECITKSYEDKLRKHFDFVGRIPISSAEESLKYYLLFATRSSKGMQVMNDVVYNVQGLRDRTLDEERREAMRFIQLDMFEPSPEEKTLHELEILKAATTIVMNNGEELRRDELRGRVASIDDNFGRFQAHTLLQYLVDGLRILVSRRNSRV